MNDRAEWLSARKRGLGGTDAAAALGVSKWKTELSVYLDKRDEAPPVEQNAPMYWGTQLQTLVRDEYKRRTGATIYNTPMIWSKRHPFMLANTDGRRLDDRRIVEIKTARSAEGWGDEGTVDIPVDYLCQVHHYMIVAEVDLADVAVLIGGSEYRQYTIPYDAELGDMIVEAERELWDRIQRGDPPAPRTTADLAALYRISKSQPIEAPDAIYAAWMQLRAVKQEIADAERRAEKLELAIKAHMRDCYTLVHGGATLATWKTAKATQRLDAKLGAAEAPDIYQRCLVTGQPSRRFLLKGAKE